MQRVSIVMATYCGEKYVEEQLCSLLAQSRPADEVLILTTAPPTARPSWSPALLPKTALPTGIFG